MKKKIGILYHDVLHNHSANLSKEYKIIDGQTNETVQIVNHALNDNGFIAKLIPINSHNIPSLTKMQLDYIFNLVDSKELEELVVKILESSKIPFSGSDLRGIQISNNKLEMKSLLIKNGIPTPGYTVYNGNGQSLDRLTPGKFPVILKPAFEHCSVGIDNHSVVYNLPELKFELQKLKKHYHEPILCEEFIVGKEYQVLVMEKNEETIALPISEMIFKNKTINKLNIYGFKEKWDRESKIYKSLSFISPPRNLNQGISEKIKKDATAAFRIFGFKDYARFDVRYRTRDKSWFFLEGNANPGLCNEPDDAITISLLTSKLTLKDLVLQIVANSISD